MNALDYRPKMKLFSDFLPYLQMDSEKNQLWLKDGSLTKTFRLVPKNIFSATEDELFVLRSGLSNILNKLPEGTFLQFYFLREKSLFF